jgi:hypothetical protein
MDTPCVDIQESSVTQATANLEHLLIIHHATIPMETAVALWGVQLTPSSFTAGGSSPFF